MESEHTTMLEQDSNLLWSERMALFVKRHHAMDYIYEVEWRKKLIKTIKDMKDEKK